MTRRFCDTCCRFTNSATAIASPPMIYDRLAFSYMSGNQMSQNLRAIESCPNCNLTEKFKSQTLNLNSWSSHFTQRSMISDKHLPCPLPSTSVRISYFLSFRQYFSCIWNSSLVTFVVRTCFVHRNFIKTKGALRMDVGWTIFLLTNADQSVLMLIFCAPPAHSRLHPLYCCSHPNSQGWKCYQSLEPATYFWRNKRQEKAMVTLKNRAAGLSIVLVDSFVLR